MSGRQFRAVFLVATFACGTARPTEFRPSPRISEPPRVVPPTAPPAEPPPAVEGRRFKPSRPGAARYGALPRAFASEPGARPDPLVADVLAAVKAAARPGRAPVEDARLDLMADELARFGELPPFELLGFLGSHFGLVEPEPMVLTFGVEAQGEKPLLARIRQDLSEKLNEQRWARVGVGVARTRDRVHVRITLQEAAFDIDPVTRQLPSGGEVILRGRLPRGLANPQAIVTTPHGRTGEVALNPIKDAIETRLRCADGDGRYQIEVTASSTRGPQVLANFPLFCGVAPPDVATLRKVDPTTAAFPADLRRAEQEMLAMANRERARAGAPPLVWDERLAQLARAYSAEMANERRIAHVSRAGGSLPDRLAQVGLRPVAAAENLGSGPSLIEIHRGLMQSPGHRANIMDAAFRAAGIGLVADPPSGPGAVLYATQVFVVWK